MVCLGSEQDSFDFPPSLHFGDLMDAKPQLVLKELLLKAINIMGKPGNHPLQTCKEHLAIAAELEDRGCELDLKNIRSAFGIQLLDSGYYESACQFYDDDDDLEIDDFGIVLISAALDPSFGGDKVKSLCDIAVQTHDDIARMYALAGFACIQSGLQAPAIMHLTDARKIYQEVYGKLESWESKIFLLYSLDTLMETSGGFRRHENYAERMKHADNCRKMKPLPADMTKPDLAYITYSAWFESVVQTRDIKPQHSKVFK